MGCTVIRGRIHTYNWSKYSDYNAKNGSRNRNDLVNRRCDWTISWKKRLKVTVTNNVNRFVLYVLYVDVCKEKAKINIPDGRNYEP